MITDIKNIIKLFKDGEMIILVDDEDRENEGCLLYTSPSPRDSRKSRMPSSA